MSSPTTAMPTWHFQREDLPSTVHGLMSLWGGFDVATEPTDSGCEKRFEVDVTFPAAASCGSLHTVDRGQWDNVFAAIGETVLEVQKTDELQYYRSAAAALVVMHEKVIMSCTAVVLLHQSVGVIIDACKSVCGVVEWASFMRKNLASPWDPDNDIQYAMAKEYAELKHRFPQGRSYLIGPVDGDHYFYFIHDAVDRLARNVVEDDVQLNLVMYNVIEGMAETNKVSHSCHILSNKGEYETFRRFTTCGQSCVTYETNSASQDHAARIAELLAEHQPDRFTMIALFDPHTVVARRLAAGDRCGLDKFANYVSDNCCTNEFAHGYIVRKTMFVRAG